MTRRLFLATSFALREPNDFAHRIFARINDLRVIRGSPPLVWSDVLARCATEQSRRKMALRFRGHEDPERGGIVERLAFAGVRWQTCGENLFEMKGYDDPVNYAIVFWWYSAGHQANLLNREYNESGIGVAQSADETFYVTQVFVRVPV